MKHICCRTYSKRKNSFRLHLSPPCTNQIYDIFTQCDSRSPSLTVFFSSFFGFDTREGSISGKWVLIWKYPTRGDDYNDTSGNRVEFSTIVTKPLLNDKKVTFGKREALSTIGEHLFINSHLHVSVFQFHNICNPHKSKVLVFQGKFLRIGNQYLKTKHS